MLIGKSTPIFLVLIAMTFASCSKFGNDNNLVADVVSEKIRNTEKEMKEIDNKLLSSQSDIKRLNNLVQALEGIDMIVEPINLTEYNSLLDQEISQASMYKMLSDYSREFYKPFVAALSSNGVFLTYSDDYLYYDEDDMLKDGKDLNQRISEFYYSNMDTEGSY
jgi:hypothetical protein